MKDYWIHKPKRFKIVLPDCFCERYGVLNYEIEDNKFIFDTHNNTELDVTYFTLLQINDFPIEIKNAIDFGFLKLVEVKENDD